jgi:hypothetical protein
VLNHCLKEKALSVYGTDLFEFHVPVEFQKQVQEFLIKEGIPFISIPVIDTLDEDDNSPSDLDIDYSDSSAYDESSEDVWDSSGCEWDSSSC